MINFENYQVWKCPKCHDQGSLLLEFCGACAIPFVSEFDEAKCMQDIIIYFGGWETNQFAIDEVLKKYSSKNPELAAYLRDKIGYYLMKESLAVDLSQLRKDFDIMYSCNTTWPRAKFLDAIVLVLGKFIKEIARRESDPAYLAKLKMDPCLTQFSRYCQLYRSVKELNNQMPQELSDGQSRWSRFCRLFHRKTNLNMQSTMDGCLKDFHKQKAYLKHLYDDLTEMREIQTAFAMFSSDNPISSDNIESILIQKKRREFEMVLRVLNEMGQAQFTSPTEFTPLVVNPMISTEESQ